MVLKYIKVSKEPNIWKPFIDFSFSQIFEIGGVENFLAWLTFECHYVTVASKCQFAGSLFLSFIQVVWSNHVNRRVTFSSVKLFQTMIPTEINKFMIQRLGVPLYLHLSHLFTVIIMVILRCSTVWEAFSSVDS